MHSTNTEYSIIFYAKWENKEKEQTDNHSPAQPMTALPRILNRGV